MEPLKDILGGVQVRQAAEEEIILAERQKTDDLLQEKREQIKNLQERIISGSDTTDSNLHDGVVVLYGDYLVDEPYILQNYERVAEQLKGKKGEPVVAITRWIEDIEHIDFGYENRRPLQAVKELTSMGVLTNEGIIFDYAEQAAYLPTETFIRSRNGFTIDIVEQGNLMIDQPKLRWFRNYALGSNIGRNLNLEDANLAFHDFGGESDSVMDLLVGRQAIHEWLAEAGNAGFGRNKSLSMMCNMCEKLGIEVVGPATRL